MALKNGPTGRPVVLVVEDDQSVQGLIAAVLQLEGMDPCLTSTAAEARHQFRIAAPDLVLLDLGLPDGDGADLLAELREATDHGVIVITGRDDPTEKVRLLRFGADDYIVKPFSDAELAARAHAVLRRSRRTGSQLGTDDLLIDLRQRKVVVRGEVIDLRAKEFDLLAHLASEPGRVYSRDELLVTVWRSRSEWQDPATVTEHIRRLRRKVEEDPDRPVHLRTVRGAGYAFEP